MNAVRLALSWLTVLPVRGPATVERAVAARAIALAPLVGVALGAGAAGSLWGLTQLQSPPLLAGLIIVAALALGTRGMHLDGLADTVDGLGCYGSAERALAVMRDGATGPFAVVALVLVLGAQAVALAQLALEGRWIAVGVAIAAGRVAMVWACRRGVPAARPDGLGALVAGSEPAWISAAWTTLLLAIGLVAVDGRWWQGPSAIVLAAVVTAGVSWHTMRRFGGVTGDVLGACSELAVTVALVVLAFG